MKLIVAVACLGLGVIGGVIGTSSVMFVHRASADREDTLRVHTLEIIDAHNTVRAVLTTDEGDGGVYLRMQSKTNAAAVNLAVIKDNGTLTFNTSNTNSLLTVGYTPDGDVVDDRRGLWGVTVAGPNHQIKGMNVITLDGMPQEFLPRAKLPPPSSPPSR
jgi:hypothetical protein